MKRSEVAELLAFCAVYDRRDLGSTDEAVNVYVEAWRDSLIEGGVTSLADAKKAVSRHFATSREYLTPVYVVEGVRAIREDRLARNVVREQDIETGDDIKDFRVQLAAARREIADGRDVNQFVAIERAPGVGTPDEASRLARELAHGQGSEFIRLRDDSLPFKCDWCRVVAGEVCVSRGGPLDGQPLVAAPAHQARLVTAGLVEAVEVRGREESMAFLESVGREGVSPDGPPRG